MPTTLDEIKFFLVQSDLNFNDPENDTDPITITFTMEYYRSPTESPDLEVHINMADDGKSVRVYAPSAWIVEDDRAPVVLQAVAMIQRKTFMVRFGYDIRDGELYAMIDLLVEDSTLSQEQLEKAVRGLVDTIDNYHTTIDLAMTKGVIVFD